METMLERVARAIYAKHCAEHIPPIQAVWDVDVSGRRLALMDARAALDAMREPTLAMEEAAAEADDDYIAITGQPLAPRSVFTVMINAALTSAPSQSTDRP